MTPEEWRSVKKVFAGARERPPEERPAFLDGACEGQPELRRHVESLLASADETGNLLDDVSFQEAAFAKAMADDTAARLGQRVGAYEIVSAIGEGGMGSVFLARRADGQFEQTVALKLVKRGMDTNAVLARFRQERGILASLHHPNIAQLYDGGATADGLPFIAMEHVEGEPLLDYCNRRRMSLPDRLKIFRSVCSAVHYAHRNLVIHRDIKPSNILVTPDGIPKLLDFGIAKIQEAGSVDRTATGIRAMTPEYASPEQIRGEPVTTATDVYSLGVVLYELLTSRLPFRVPTPDPASVARIVCEQEPVRPGTLVRELKGDLENIVLMAMRKEPERRYASAEQLGEDIRLYLEGRPILARKDTLAYRTGKFVRRNRLAVLAAAVTFLGLTAGLVLALAQAHRASEAEARAKSRFEEVRSLAGSFLFEFHDAVENLPGSTPARKLVVQRGLEYLDRLSGESAGNPGLRRELAAGYLRLGEVQGGQGSNLGDTKGAVASFRKAVAIREGLAHEAPGDFRPQMELAASYRTLADALATTGDESAAGYIDRAVRIWQTLAAAHPRNRQVLASLAVGYWERSNRFIDRMDYRGALGAIRKAVEIVEGLVRSDPSNRRFQYNLALYEKNAGALLEKLGDPAGALELFDKAIVLDQARRDADPSDASALLDLSYSYGSRAGALSGRGDFAAALASYGKSIALRQELSASDPKNVRYRLAIAQARERIGWCEHLAGNDEAGAAALRLALRDRETLSDADPSNVYHRLGVARGLELIGDLERSIAERPKLAGPTRRRAWLEARAAYRRGVDVLHQMRADGKLTADPAKLLQAIEADLAACDAALAKFQGP